MKKQPTFTPSPDVKMVNAYHFLNNTRRLGFGDSRLVKLGAWLGTKRMNDKLVLCANGMHASRHPWDALKYITNEQTIFCKVQVYGEILKSESGDKLCGRYRRVVTWCDAKPAFQEFITWCMEEALRVNPVPRSSILRKTVRVYRQWINGKISRNECESVFSQLAALDLTFDELNKAFYRRGTHGKPAEQRISRILYDMILDSNPCCEEPYSCRLTTAMRKLLQITEHHVFCNIRNLREARAMRDAIEKFARNKFRELLLNELRKNGERVK